MASVVPTIATRIGDRAERQPSGVAFREKSLGIWRETSWKEYRDLVERAAHGLLALGVNTYDCVAIRCENRPEWLVAEAGAIAARAAIGPIDAGARVLIAEDQEQVDIALECKPSLPNLEFIVYIEPRGVRDYKEPSLVSWPDLLARGAVHRAGHPRLLDELASELTEDDPVAPGLSAREVNEALATQLHPDPGPRDFVLCHLPLSQTPSRLSGAWLNAHAGVQLHFGEPSADLIESLQEVQPSLFLGTPGVWETLRARLGTRTRRLFARAARDRLGMRKCRSALSLSPLPAELADWYRRLGINVRSVELPEGVV
jgi:long-chain acyl-CoA synthetase